MAKYTLTLDAAMSEKFKTAKENRKTLRSSKTWTEEELLKAIEIMAGNPALNGWSGQKHGEKLVFTDPITEAEQVAVKDGIYTDALGVEFELQGITPTGSGLAVTVGKEELYISGVSGIFTFGNKSLNQMTFVRVKKA